MTRLPKAYVDGFLVEWEANEYEAGVKMLAQRSRPLKTDISPGTASEDTARRAQAVRARLARMVRQAPEVMVKITSSCRGTRQIGRHIDYISRKGALELEDQDRFILMERDELAELKSDWQSSGPEPIASSSSRRDTLNIVFSMPAHTDEVSMKRAVRAFAAEEFAGHQYVFAYHTSATDPDPKPPAHPHVHLSVKTQARDGRRLNPRKADLQRWREQFAAQLRAHGIDANATSRLARLKQNRGVDRGVLALKARGESGRESSLTGSSAGRVVRGKILEANRRAYYNQLCDVLMRSEDAGDRLLGSAIKDRFQDRRPIPGQER